MMDSLPAFVIRCRRYVMMFSNRRWSIRATSIIGCSRLLTAQLCHPRRTLLRLRSSATQHARSYQIIHQRQIAMSLPKSLLIDTHLAHQLRLAALQATLHCPRHDPVNLAAPDGAHNFVVFSGLTSAGTGGAATFFTSGTDLKNLAERFRRDGLSGWPKSYQVVVRCRTSDDSQLLSDNYETHEVLIK